MEDSAPAIFSLLKALFKKQSIKRFQKFLSIFLTVFMIYLIMSRNDEIDESIKSQKKTETAVLLIQKGIKGIKENFDNHITDTDEKIDELSSNFKGLSSDFKGLSNRFNNLYEILLKKEIEKK